MEKLELLGLLYRKLLEINESNRTAVLLMDEVQMLYNHRDNGGSGAF